MLSLRPATPADEARLLEWRNDPAVRHSAFNSGVVDPVTHGRWFAQKLRDPEARLMIVERDGRALGQVRLDRRGDEAEVDVALAAEARGQGNGSEALRLALRAAAEMGVARLRARVKPDNTASLRAFAAAGFEQVSASALAVELIADVQR